MFAITLVSSFHKPLGKCNSNELYQIIRALKPDVIFEELGVEVFNSIYFLGDAPQTNESIAVSAYLKTHPSKHFPVDTYPKDRDALLSDAQVIFDNSKEYKLLWEEQLGLIAQEGYLFLNSDYCSVLLEKMDAIETEVLSELGLSQLLNELEAEKHLHAKREAVILENIYNHSRQHAYNNAIVILGAQHRKPIKKLIKQYQLSEDLKLNWSFYNEEH